MRIVFCLNLFLAILRQIDPIIVGGPTALSQHAAIRASYGLSELGTSVPERSMKLFSASVALGTTDTISVN